MHALKLADAMLFLSTLSLRRATACLPACVVGAPISIHALLAESDAPQPPQGESSIKFLSTLSLRRATRLPTALRTPHHRFLSTLSLRRATGKTPANITLHFGFLSTLSLRRATARRASRQHPAGISIHALLAESDNISANNHVGIRENFYPRSPCGERHANLGRHRGNDDFYPRSPCGERPTVHQ